MSSRLMPPNVGSRAATICQIFQDFFITSKQKSISANFYRYPYLPYRLWFRPDISGQAATIADNGDRFPSRCICRVLNIRAISRQGSATPGETIERSRLFGSFVGTTLSPAVFGDFRLVVAIFELPYLVCYLTQGFSQCNVQIK